MYMGLYTAYARLRYWGSRDRTQGVRRHTSWLGTHSGIAIAIPEALAHGLDRKSTRLNSSHSGESRMPSSA